MGRAWVFYKESKAVEIGGDVMRKEKVYTLNKNIPYELSEALCKWIDNRDRASRMIKSYTDDWVKAQKKIIEINKSIEILNKNKVKDNEQTIIN